MVTLREVRVNRMLSIRDLAKVADVSPTTIQLAEAGQQLPRFKTMRKIANALGVEPAEIAEFAAAIEAAGRGEEAA